MKSENLAMEFQRHRGSAVPMSHDMNFDFGKSKMQS